MLGQLSDNDSIGSSLKDLEGWLATKTLTEIRSRDLGCYMLGAPKGNV